MSEEDTLPGDAAELRRRAEELARESTAQPREEIQALSPEETWRSLHELRVHQIELEMQNEELRRAQEELDASRARYFELYDLAPAGYCTVSEQGLILEANLAAATLLGETRGALLKQRLTSFILPGDEDLYYLRRKHLFETGEPQACELRMLKKDGTAFWAHLAATAAAGAGGAPVGRVVLTDITARKQTEEALRESEMQYRTLADSGQALIWTAKPGAKRDYFNQPWLDFTGRRLEPELGDGWAEGVHPDDREHCIGIYTRACERRERFSMDYRLRRHDGEFRWLQDDGMPRYDSQGDFLGYIGHCLDITARKQAEEDLRESEERFRLLVTHAGEGIVFVDLEERFGFANPAAEAIFGVSANGLAGRSLEEFLTPEGFRQILEESRKRQRNVESGYELEIVQPAGTKRRILVTAVPRPAREGRIEGTFGVFRDITARKRAEEALRESERHYRSLFENMLEGFAYCQMLYDDHDRPADFVYLAVNPAFEQLTGLREVVGKPVSEVIPGIRESSPQLFEIYGRVAATGNPEKFELDFAPLGRWLSISAYGLEKGRFVAVFEDITERKLNEADRETMLAVLRLANASNNSQELIRAVTAELQGWSGCAAVGIRLREGDDFPYYETRGFPAEFVEAENYLCARDANQEPLRASDGNPVLECMCGNILCGRFDPRQPFFTPGGSFWTNSASQLLASTTEADREARTRNRCHGEGFESVALIPLRCAGRTLGLLQFNDRRPDRFTPAAIALMERAAASMAMALEQRMTQAALRESEEKYRTVADFTYDWEYWISPTREMRYVSPSCERVTGYSAAQFLGDPGFLSGIIHPADQNAYERHLCEVLAPGHNPELVETEFRIIASDGSVRSIAHGCRSVFGADGAWLGRRASNRDVTGRKRAEEALRESEEKYRSLVETAQELVWICDWEGRFTYLNPAWEKTHGYPLAEMLGRRFGEFQRPEVFARDLREFSRHLAGGSVKEYETTHISRQGRELTLLFNAIPLRDSTGAVIGTQGTAIDISVRKRAEEALHASEFRLAAGADLAGLGFYEIAGGERVTYLDDRGRAILGLPPELGLDVPGVQFWMEHIHRDDFQRMLDAHLRLNDGRLDRFSAEYRFLHPDHGQKWVQHLACVTRRDAAGRAVHTIGVLQDITGRKQAEEEKAHLEAQLQQAQKMESIGRLAGGVAHDFNNLLTVINGYSQLLLGKLSADDPLRAGLAEIHKAGERAAGLTGQLLAFSRKQILEPRRLDVNRVVEEMRPMLERLVGETVEVRIALNAGSATVHADPHQLEQVVMNLAVNARDAMPEGGKLLIETAVVEWGESDAQAHPEARAGRYVMLAVSDSGMGIDERTRRQIFEPFFTTKGVGQGTGLGLSMIQGIVAQSGGYINVYSEPGHGATFKIYLPALAGAAAETVRPAAVAALGGTETVLVVEDQAEVREYAVMVLNSYGYRVLQAESAAEALRLCALEGGRIHLVLTDVVMPNMSGRELAGRLDKLRPGVKVLFMSGYTGDAIVHQGVLQVDAEFIQKPFSPAALAGKVRAVLGPPAPLARILVADDEPGVRAFLREVLERAGYEVLEAADGKQALRQARAVRVDLVITDLIMPEQEGIETIKALRQEMPGIGIIAISGRFDGPWLQIAASLGADAVLAKPLTEELLLSRVAEVLPPGR